jgi:hypothetical protein
MLNQSRIVVPDTPSPALQTGHRVKCAIRGYGESHLVQFSRPQYPDPGQPSWGYLSD